jgi:uncharacterized DUF497 family protein
MDFDWDENKNRDNLAKHGISFENAQEAFFDPDRVIRKDEKHSTVEERFFCIGKIVGGIATVRYTRRNETSRIFGAGFWREGRKFYAEKKHLR